jgi:hypothetical protein
MKVLRIDLGSDMMDIDVTPIKVVRDLVEALKRVPNLTFDQTLEMQVHDTAQSFLENRKIVTLTWSNKPVSDPKPEDHDDHTTARSWLHNFLPTDYED